MENRLTLFSKLITVVSGFALICSCKFHVNVGVVPLWDDTSGQSSVSCLLSRDSSDDLKKSIFRGNTATTCSVQIETSVELGILVQIPQWVSPATFIYIERVGDLLNCQNRYTVIAADQPCDILFSHSKFKLYLKGDATVIISDIPRRQGSKCPNYVTEHHEISDMRVCSTREFNYSISCVAFFNGVCSFESLSDCYVILGNRYVEYKCGDNNSKLHISRTDLIVYPDQISELDLLKQNITEVGENAFISVTITEKLNLNYNKIVKLHPRVFKGLKTVRKLFIQGNQIYTLDTHIFDGMFGLVELDLSENYLTSLPFGLFNDTRQLRVLLINNNNLSVYPKGLFNGLSTRLLTLYISHNQVTTLDPGVFHATVFLFHLWINSNHITHLPNDLFQKLIVLQMLRLDENRITFLPSDIFKNLVILIELNLGGNQITTLHENLFYETRKLISLTISNNNLTFLPNGLFKRLINLEILNLNENQIALFPRHLVKDIKNLKQLNLAFNHLTTLNGNLFNDRWTLSLLNISGNNLTFLPTGLLKGLINLTFLYITDNQVTNVDMKLFNETRRLKYLSLRRNKLTHLPNRLFKGLNNLEIFRVSKNQIRNLDGDLFNETRRLTSFTISSNRLSVLPSNLFYGLFNLRELFIYDNNLTSLDAMLFYRLLNLRVLMMHTNTLTKIGFELLRDLKMLEYFGASENRLTHLDGRTFQGMNNLQIVTLRFNRLRYIDSHIFMDTINLNFLDLSGNQLSHIPAINHLAELTYFNLLNTKLTMIDKNTFKDLPKQAELVVNQTEICDCYVPNDIKCTAVNVRSPYLTCQRLLSDRVLMVMMWLIGLNAIGGNMFVLCRKKSKNEKNSVQTFLLSNLALSDLLMGIYMLIIASADIYFGERFPMRAETWRSGITCRIAGAMSIISSEASVFFLTLITIDRFINIRFPFSEYKLRKRSSAVTAGLLWLTSIVMGTAPAVLAGRSYKFYDNSHVCIGLPLAQIEMFMKKVTIEYVKRFRFNNYKYIATSESLGYVSGLYYSTAVFLGLNTICFVVILTCYIEIIRYALKSSGSAGLKKSAKDEITMTMKIAFIVLTDFCCWCPIIVLGVLVQLELVILPASVFAWCVTVVLPINSAINPYLYTIAAIVSNRRKEAQK